MDDHRSEEKYFYETDDGIGDKELAICLVLRSVVIRKEKQIADEMLNKKDYEKHATETHEDFLAEG